MKTILIVDDDEYINNLLLEALTKEGYNVLRAFSGSEALMVLQNNTPDLILLDLMLPGVSGEEVIKKIEGIPVIVVSAKIDIDNKVNLLLGGAADFVTKPFDLRELMARITLQLRDAEVRRGGKKLFFEDITVDVNKHAAFIKETELRLTKTEFAILKTLMRSSGSVVTKATLLDKISLETPDCMESSLKVHISNLRKKLREAGDKEYIESVWGIGFKIG